MRLILTAPLWLPLLILAYVCRIIATGGAIGMKYSARLAIVIVGRPRTT